MSEKLDERRCETCYYCETDDDNTLCCVNAKSDYCAETVPWWDVCDCWSEKREDKIYNR